MRLGGVRSPLQALCHIPFLIVFRSVPAADRRLTLWLSVDDGYRIRILLLVFVVKGWQASFQLHVVRCGGCPKSDPVECTCSSLIASFQSSIFDASVQGKCPPTGHGHYTHC